MNKYILVNNQRFFCILKSKTTAKKIKTVDLSCDIDNYTIIKTKNINEATFFVSAITAEKIKEKYTGRLKGYYITSYKKYIQEKYHNLDNNKLTNILKQDEFNIISKKEDLTAFSDKEKNTLEKKENKSNKTNKRIIFTEEIRKRVYEKSNGICGICNDPIPYDSFTIDHIIPLSKNGENKIRNLQCACAVCNNMKSNLTPLEFEEKIKKIYEHHEIKKRVQKEKEKKEKEKILAQRKRNIIKNTRFLEYLRIRFAN